MDNEEQNTRYYYTKIRFKLLTNKEGNMTIKQVTPEKQGLIYRYVDLISQCEEKNTEMQYALEYALKFVPNKDIKRWIDLTEKQIRNQQAGIV